MLLEHVGKLGKVDFSDGLDIVKVVRFKRGRVVYEAKPIGVQVGSEASPHVLTFTGT